MICNDDLDNCNTLGELISLGHTLTAVCIPCNQHTVLDLENLKDRYGEDARVRRVALKLVCEECGRRDGDILVTPHTSYS